MIPDVFIGEKILVYFTSCPISFISSVFYTISGEFQIVRERFLVLICGLIPAVKGDVMTGVRVVRGSACPHCNRDIPGQVKNRVSA